MVFEILRGQLRELPFTVHGVGAKASAQHLVYSLVSLLERRASFKMNTVWAKVDLSKAYDCVGWPLAAAALEWGGTGEDIVHGLLRTYQWTRLLVKTPGGEEYFNVPVGRGLPQGHPASPLVFAWVVAYVTAQIEAKAAQRELGVMVGMVRLTAVSYFDDILGVL